MKFKFTFSVAYVIYYGTWPSASQAIIQTFLSGLGSTAYWAINKAYGGVGALVYKGFILDNYSQGKSLEAPWNVIQNAFNKKLLPQNTNAIYLVLSSRYTLSLQTFVKHCVHSQALKDID
jgi:hypothetical protein